MLSAGKLNRRVILRQRVAGHDAAGQPSASWSDLASVWANVRVLSGAQAIKADAEISTVRASIRIRLRDDVTAGMIVVDGSTTYDIRAVVKNAAEAFADLLCEVSS